MSGENLNYRTEYEDEVIDWTGVEREINAAAGAAGWIEAIQRAGILDAGDDKQLGRVAQNALEFAYQAVIAAYGSEYPASGRAGHNLTILSRLLRDYGSIGRDEAAPGENHRYLTEFGGAAVQAPKHPPLDRRRIAAEVPEAVARLRDLANGAGQWSGC